MTELNLNELSGIGRSAELLSQKQYEYLDSYWDGERHCFHANQGAVGTVSVTSTSFCIFATLRDPLVLERFVRKAAAPESMLAKVADCLYRATWTSEQLPEYNIYTTPIVVTAIYAIEASGRDRDAVADVLRAAKNREKMSEGVRRILSAVEPQGCASFSEYSPSAYLTYWSYEALSRAIRDSHLDEKLRQRSRRVLFKISAWAESEVYKQIALHSAADMGAFDATQLAYAVAIYTRGCAEATKRFNRNIVTRSIAIIFENQLADGLWPKSHPIFHYATRGNVYTFSFELIDVLLGAEGVRDSSFDPYVSRLAASLRWAEENEVTAGTKKGWRSNLLAFEGGAEAWSTAATLMATQRIRRLVADKINRVVLSHLHTKHFSRPDPSYFDGARFYDAEVPNAEPASLKLLLQRYLIAPHLPGGNEKERRYSAVFFGPPGTAKTTIAEGIACALGWPFVYLQTSDFSGEGVSHVTGKARDLFNRLMMIEKAVVLFDEVEEFVRDREAEKLADSRMITACMLSLIQELRRGKKVIFIVATNFLKSFDAAIKREGGRFDMILLIAPPSRDEKKRLFRDTFGNVAGSKGSLDQHCQAFDTFVDRAFNEVQYFTFPEWSSFVARVIADIAKGENMNEATLEAALGIRASSIVLRGALRTDYEESKKMIRV